MCKGVKDDENEWFYTRHGGFGESKDDSEDEDVCNKSMKMGEQLPHLRGCVKINARPKPAQDKKYGSTVSVMLICLNIEYILILWSIKNE